jgi:hypothetical protein
VGPDGEEHFGEDADFSEDDLRIIDQVWRRIVQEEQQRQGGRPIEDRKSLPGDGHES